MKRLLLLSIAALLLASCAGTPRPASDTLGRALDAIGGADAADRVRSVYLKSQVRHFEPEQSIVPGGATRLAGESTVEQLRDFAGGSVRQDWVRNLVYPAARQYKFTEIVQPDAGYVAGVDATARNKQSLESSPPAHAMSGLRLAAAQRELARSSPLLLAQMQRNPTRVTQAADVRIGETTYRALDYRHGDRNFTVLFDPATGLPARVRTLDYDNMWGDSTFDLVLADWRDVGGLKLALSQRYLLNEMPVAEIRISEARINPPVSAERFEIPQAIRAGASKPATGNVPWQWVLRRQFVGVYMDSDVPSFDTRATQSLRLADLAPGVAHVLGGTHNSLLVEMSDHLIAFDAPVSDWQSNWTLKAAQEKFPGKPVRYLVLTHHHMDHAGGLRAYLAQGATLVVGKGAAAHYRTLLARPATRNPDLGSRNLADVRIVEVADRHTLSDGRRTVDALVVPNPHAEALLVGYVADAQLGFVTDIWSPGRDPLGEKLSAGQAALVKVFRAAGVAPLRFAGGHGTMGDWALLEALAAK